MEPEFFLRLGRYLRQRDVDLDQLPPFAVTPEQEAALRNTNQVAWENSHVMHGDGTFTVHGIRCARAERLVTGKKDS